MKGRIIIFFQTSLITQSLINHLKCATFRILVHVQTIIALQHYLIPALVQQALGV